MVLPWYSHHGEQLLVPLQLQSRTQPGRATSSCPQGSAEQTLMAAAANSWVRLQQHLRLCCGHLPTPGTAGFNPAQESSPTRAPNTPKAPKSSTGCSRLSVLRLSEGPLEAQSRATAVPGSQAKRYRDGLGETSCYCGHIPLAQGRMKGCSQGSQPSWSRHKDKHRGGWGWSSFI